MSARLISIAICVTATYSSSLFPAETARAGEDSVSAPVVIVGADGLTFDLLRPMVKAGKLPAFRRLLDEGVQAILLSERPMRSPALWTTLATGQPRQVHRVFDFVTGSGYWPEEERKKPRKLVTSGMRAAPALWELAPSKKSLVVGWLNTWPAERINGVVVAPFVALGEKRQISIKGKVYRDARGQTHPPELFDSLEETIVSPTQIKKDLLSRIVREPPKSSRLYRKVPQLEGYMYGVRWTLASALTNTRILESLLSEQHYDLVMTYYDGADTLGHRFWAMRQPLRFLKRRMRAHGLDPRVAPELKRRFGRAVDGYYQLLDSQLARLWKAAGENATVMVVSDHGWGGLETARAPQDEVPFNGEHRLEGVFVAHGPALESGRIEPLTLYDVAPTVLYLLGENIPASLPGKVATAALKKEVIEARPVTRSGGPSKQRPVSQKEQSEEAPFEADEIERLRSLGYVE